MFISIFTEVPQAKSMFITRKLLLKISIHLPKTHTAMVIKVCPKCMMYTFEMEFYIFIFNIHTCPNHFVDILLWNLEKILEIRLQIQTFFPPLKNTNLNTVL